jgi:hypothetical protein
MTRRSSSVPARPGSTYLASAPDSAGDRRDSTPAGWKGRQANLRHDFREGFGIVFDSAAESEGNLKAIVSLGPPRFHFGNEQMSAAAPGTMLDLPRPPAGRAPTPEPPRPSR